MKILLRLLCLLAAVLLFSGCVTGGATELHLKFGVPGVFSVEKNATGITSEQGIVSAKTGDTKIQIALFGWESSGKDVVLKKPADLKP